MAKDQTKTGDPAPEHDEDPLGAELAALHALSPKRLRIKLATLTEEYRFLAPEANAGHGPALQRRHEIARLQKMISQIQFLRQPDVEITVSRSATGHAFTIGERKFPPGIYVVKSSVAQQLLWMMDANRRQEMARLQQNGHDIDLTGMSTRARMQTITRDDTRTADY